MSASATPRDPLGEGSTPRRLAVADDTPPAGDSDITPRAEPDREDMSSEPGEVSLPRTARTAFEVAGQFAQGGIGRILRARDPILGRTVALKELLVAGDRGDEQRFVREVLLTARLQHPGIVPVYSAGRWPSGEPFYAMKLVSGRSFDLLIAEARTLSARLALLPHVLAIAETLAFAHAQSIIHRDLKPNNVLVGEFGETVVIDWGLAKQLDEPDIPDLPGRATPGPTTLNPQQLTHVGAVVGTPGFMSPEQANSDPVDARTDVYALGVILYQTLTGQLPHDAANAAEMLFKTVFDPPVALLQREPQAPEELAAIVDKAMARDPAHRYPTAKALADDLRRFQTGQIVGAHRYTAWELLRRLVRRYRTALLVAAVALVVVVVVLAVSFNRVSAERDRALRAELFALTRADNLALAQARILADSDPVSTLALLHGLSPAADWRRIRQLAATAHDRGLPTVLQGHQAALSRALFSADSSRLATTSDDCTLRVWNLHDHSSRAYFGHTNEVWRAAWSPDQRRIATSSRDTTVRVWDLASGDAQALLGHQAGVRNVAFTPDGNSLYSHSDDLVLRRWDLTTNTGRDVDHCSGNNFLWDDHQVSCLTDTGEVHIHDLATGQRTDLRTEAPLPSRSGAVSPDQRWLAVGTAEPVLWLWNRSDPTPRRLRFDAPPPHPNGPRRDLRFSPDGRSHVAAFESHTLATIDLATGAITTRRPHDGYVRRFSFSPDGTLLASVGGDSKVQVWDRLRQSERTLAGGPALMIDVQFSPDGSQLAAVGNDPRVFVWPTAGLRRQLWSFGALAVPHAAPAAHRALFFTRQRQVVLDTRTLQPVREFTQPVLSASISRDGARLLTVDPSGTLTAHDIDGDALLWRAAGPPVTACFHYHDDHHLLLTCDANPARWVDLSTGVAINLPPSSPAPIVSFVADRPELLLGGRDGLLHVWHPAGNELRPLHRYPNAINASAPVPGLPQMVIASDSILDVWDLESGSSRRISGHSLQINGIHVSRDRRRMATLSRDNRIRVFDFASGELLWSLSAPELLGSRVALSDDGDSLAASLNSGTLLLWDLSGPPGPADLLELRTLRGHDSNVDHIEFEPGGLLSLGRDGRAIRWRDDLPRDPAALRAWVDARHEPGAATPISRSGCLEPP